MTSSLLSKVNATNDDEKWRKTDGGTQQFQTDENGRVGWAQERKAPRLPSEPATGSSNLTVLLSFL